MQEMAMKLQEQYPDLFNTKTGDIRGLSVARGNIQQLAQAANYMLMRGENPNYKTTAPMPTAGGLIPRGCYRPCSPFITRYTPANTFTG